MISKLIVAASNPANLGGFTQQSTLLDSFNLNKDTTGASTTKALNFLISDFIGLITVVGGIALVFYFVTGALNWITANGDSGKTEKARTQMIQAVTGMVIVVAAYSVIGLIGNFLGLNLLDPGKTLLNLVKPNPNGVAP